MGSVLQALSPTGLCTQTQLAHQEFETVPLDGQHREGAGVAGAMGSLPTHKLIYEGERWPAWVEERDELVSAVSVEAARQLLPVS